MGQVKNMLTKLVLLEEEKNISECLKEAGSIIKNGGLVAFPTETVYGLGGDALNPESSGKIYRAKGRPSDNPLIIHISQLNDLYQIAEDVPDTALQLAEAFWPGPLTMILKKRAVVPKETTGGLDTVAVRMPSHPQALEFIREAGGFVAAPSANLSGRPSPTLAKYVCEDMNGKIEMILDGGMVGIGLESTIIDLTCRIPAVLRPGYITTEMLEKVIGTVETDRSVLNSDSKEPPRAPGMKYRHYAPKGDLTVVIGTANRVIERINALSAEKADEGAKVGVIAAEETAAEYLAPVVKKAGSKGNEEEIARNLYRILREFDEEGVTCIYSEGFSQYGMGQAIMNRLLKAAGHHIENV